MPSKSKVATAQAILDAARAAGLTGDALATLETVTQNVTTSPISYHVVVVEPDSGSLSKPRVDIERHDPTAPDTRQARLCSVILYGEPDSTERQKVLAALDELRSAYAAYGTE